jgi:putative ABC transport system permease protein
MDHWLQDLRHAVRALARTPGFTLVTVMTLALGIGANTAIFSIVNGVVLQPLGYPKPEQLMFLTSRFPAQGFDQFWVSPPEFFEFRELNQSFTEVGAFTTGEVNLMAGDRPRRVRSAAVTDDLMRALQIPPAQGRLFAKGETDVTSQPGPPGTPPPAPPQIAILSHELWQAAFCGREMVGQTVEINGLTREIIGIMPPGADVMDNRTEVWLPLGLNPANRQNRGNHYLYLIGRLKDGITPEAAQGELTSLIASWRERTGVKQHVFAPLPAPVPGEARPGAGHILQMEPVQEEIVGGASRAIWVLQASVGLVLLIACANLANLLLARAETRHREFAVRTALGAGRARLLQQFMTEGVLLSVAGGALGLVLARVGVTAILRAYPNSLPRTAEVAVDPAVLLFTLGVSVATGIVFGFAPIMHTRIAGLAAALKEGGARGATSSARHHVRRGLVVAEVALAVMLVIGAGLLLRTVYNLASVDAGFDRSRLVTFAMSVPSVTYPQGSQRVQLFQRLLGRLRELPGVQGATAMSGLPPERQVNANDTDIDNYTAPPDGPFENVDYYQSVMSDYFDTMGIPIVEGRGFVATDAGSPGPVTVVNETMVRTFWKGQNPIGQRVKPGGPTTPWFTVIGVAKDVKQGGVDKKTGTELYFLVDQTAALPPLANQAPTTMNLVLRSTLPAAALSSGIEAAVRDTDQTVPVVRLREMEAVFDESIRRPRLLAQLLGAFAGLALLLAAIGTYGVLSYSVLERRREIGIRMALGARQGSVLAQVMTQGLLLAAIGVAGGLAGAFAISRVLSSLLFGVQPTDPATMAAVVGTIAVVATVACALPAWRASRVDPIVVLRDE